MEVSCDAASPTSATILNGSEFAAPQPRRPLPAQSPLVANATVIDASSRSSEGTSSSSASFTFSAPAPVQVPPPTIP
ncbi:hypothetical protein WJX75_001837 [Coccomyxa subellipsoidea]|uniref:Uncharacterized protein n=1 Tax=Coccomyxa subellipsoidea TaxID=248742 RepID=A0ABR2YUZ8_9CHLO